MSIHAVQQPFVYHNGSMNVGTVYTLSWSLIIYKLFYSPIELLYPSCLHTTVASLLSQLVSQTVPHLPSKQISTLP